MSLRVGVGRVGKTPGVRRTAVAAALVMALASGCSAALDRVAVLGGAPAGEGGATTSTARASGGAATTLASLPVKGRAPKTGYTREQFGPAWADVDRNGCDTRNDVLKRDLEGETFKPGTRDCVVAAGTLDDPYTARRIAFTRGQSTSDDVQIDHVVALSDAWQKGAQQLDDATRRNLANDPLNLMAVDGPTNQGKGDSDAATWLPPNRPFRCKYVARQVAVKAKYHLYVTDAERDAISKVLAGCPGEPLPTDRTLPAPK
ncbi:MAG TPA: HNH endonuclease family protein [Pseudonocardia sp.]